jgi:hypothetical protein
MYAVCKFHGGQLIEKQSRRGTNNWYPACARRDNSQQARMYAGMSKHACDELLKRDAIDECGTRPATRPTVRDYGSTFKIQQPKKLPLQALFFSPLY